MKNRQKAPKRPEPQQNWFELEAERQEIAAARRRVASL